MNEHLSDAALDRAIDAEAAALTDVAPRAGFTARTLSRWHGRRRPDGWTRQRAALAGAAAAALVAVASLWPGADRAEQPLLAGRQHRVLSAPLAEWQQTRMPPPERPTRRASAAPAPRTPRRVITYEAVAVPDASIAPLAEIAPLRVEPLHVADLAVAPLPPDKELL